GSSLKANFSSHCTDRNDCWTPLSLLRGLSGDRYENHWSRPTDPDHFRCNPCRSRPPPPPSLHRASPPSRLPLALILEPRCQPFSPLGGLCEDPFDRRQLDIVSCQRRAGTGADLLC